MSKCPVCESNTLAAARRVALKALCNSVVSHPAYVKRDITGDGKDETFCNQAVAKIADTLGCRDFAKKPLANEMIGIMEKKWRKVTPLEAAAHAEHGGLAVAAKKAEPHGHVAVIFPDPMQLSPSLNQYVPIAANVGRINKIGRVTEFFPIADGLPEFFTWQPTA